jgi:flagellin
MSTIGTSIAAVSASNYLTVNNEMLTKSIRRLSSGSRLADPVDDAAGVAVSGNLDARIKRLAAAVEGAQNLISFGQTIDGFLSTMQSIVTRMSELSQRATNGAFSNQDRANYQVEFGKLGNQFSDIVVKANFNNSTVFTGAGFSITTAIDASGNTDVFGANNAYSGLVFGAGISSILGTTVSDTGSAIVNIALTNGLISSITTARANVNADISKFNFYISNIRTEKVNVEATNSRIKDLNVADESTVLAKNNILVQAATAMLAQANTTQNTVLQLLQ